MSLFTTRLAACLAQDWETATVSGDPSTLRKYTRELIHRVNSNYEKVCGKKLVPGFTPVWIKIF